MQLNKRLLRSPKPRRALRGFEQLEDRVVPANWSGDIFDAAPGVPLWTNGEVQRVLGDVHVPAGKTLTVQAGTVVQFGRNVSLIVDGTLRAVGESGQIITFTGDGDNSPLGGGNTASPGDWSRISFTGNSTNNLLDRVVVRYGGRFGVPMVETANAPLTITNSTISNSGATGVRLAGSTTATLTNNVYSNNGLPFYPAVHIDPATRLSISGATFTNNTFNAVVVDGGSLPAGTTTWNSPDVPFGLADKLIVPVGSTLVLGAGQIVKVASHNDSEDSIVVNGTLRAQGTAAQPVVITSTRDDSVGGDSDNNGATQGVAGDWHNVRFTSTSTGNVLDHVELRYAGGGNAAPAAIIASGAPLTLTNSTIRNSTNGGVRLLGATATLTANTFRDNRNGFVGGAAGVRIDPASQLTINGTTFINNDINAVAVDGGSLPAGTTTWNNPGVVYWISNPLTVPAGSTLALSAGQVVKIVWRNGGGSSLIVNGRLTANGTAAQPITITSMDDDSIGGDSDNNGPSTGGQFKWNGILFTGGSTNNVLDHVDVAYGTDADGTHLGMLSVDGAIAISNSVLRNSGHDAVFVGAGGSAVLASNLIVNNISGVQAQASATLTAINNTIDGSTFFGVILDSPTATLTNNLITNHGNAGIVQTGPTNLTMRFNDVFNPTASSGNYSGLPNQTGTNGNLSVDPKYVDRAARDYNLAIGSPVVDAGTSTGAPATDFAGNPRFDDPNVTGRGDGSGFDIGAIEVQQSAMSKIDLAGLSVSGPATGVVGQSVTLNWTVKNEGIQAATGSWTDSVYLSTDDVLDADDVLITRAPRVGPVASGASYSGQATASLPGVLPGPYHVIVVADSGLQLSDDLNRANNAASSSATIRVTVPVLTLSTGGTPVASTGTLAAGQDAYYQLLLPQQSAARITLNTVAAGGAALSESYQSIPTSGSFDQSTYDPASARQQIDLTSPQPGLYYIRLRGQGSGGSYSLTATLPTQELASVSPGTVGNAGQATITLHGANFAPGSAVTLTSGGAPVAANRVVYHNSSTLYATFDLAGVAAGLYGVQVGSGAGAVTLPQALRVTAGAAGRLNVQVVVPAAARAGTVVSGQVVYTNVGLSDLVAPIIYLSSPTGTLFTRDLSGLPSVSEDSFLAAGRQGPAGMLQPGESVTVPLLIQAPATGGLNFEITSSFIDRANSTPMAWAYVSDAVSSFASADPMLPAVLAAMKAATGTTWGEFDAMLATNASLLPVTVGNPQDLTALLHHAYDRAKASLSASISGSVVSTSAALELPGQRIVAVNASDSTSRVGSILNDGSFVLTDLTPGPYSLRVQGAAAISTTPGTITVSSGVPITGVTVTVAPQVVLAGVVTDPGGVPVPAANVVVFAGTTAVGRATSDAGGNYQVTGLTPGDYTIVTLAASLSQTTQSNVSVAGPFNVVNLSMNAQATAAGSATLPGGSAATDVYVQASLRNSPTPMSLFNAVGDGSGTFTLSGLPAGTYDLTLISVTGASMATLAGVVVGASGQVQLGPVQLQPMAPGSGGPLGPRSSAPASGPLTDAGTRDYSIHDPGNTTPLLKRTDTLVEAATAYLATVGLPLIGLAYGNEDQELWSLFVQSRSDSHAPRQFFGPGSSLVEGSWAPFGNGFRKIDTEDEQQKAFQAEAIQGIRNAVVKGVQKMFENGTLNCDAILDQSGGVYTLKLNATNFPNLIPAPGKNLLRREEVYNGVKDLPGNLAGGIAAAAPFTPGTGIGQQYDDNRYWDGSVSIVLAGDGRVTLTYRVNNISNDTVDFNPGNKSGGLENALIIRYMDFLELVGQSFDVPFQVSYPDARFTQQTITITHNAPVCPDADRPRPPGRPGGSGKGTSASPIDPNSIDGPGPWVTAQQLLPYTVHFENLPTATAPAAVVKVVQQLDADLDWSTFRFGSIGFGEYVTNVPQDTIHYRTRIDANSTVGVYVDVIADFNPATGLVTWTFTSIDPVSLDVPVGDPFAGFLPPNTTPPDGDGFATYTVRPKAAAATGTILHNLATVIFDAGLPSESSLNTPPLINRIDVSAPTSSVAALAATQSSPVFTVNWSGTDAGSGIATYSVFVSDNGGAFTAFRTATTATSASFTGVAGHTYSFYSVATDNVGLVQSVPAGAQATTFVSVPPPTPPATLIGTRNFAVGPDTVNQPFIRFLDSNGQTTWTLPAFDGATVGVRTAVADFNGDGTDDVAVGTGPGIAAEVRVYDGITRTELFRIQPFGDFTGGVFLAAGDTNGDEQAELVVTPDQGGGPRVTIFSGGDFSVLANFFGIDDSNFRGGARSSLGDVDGDGFSDLVVSAGFGGGPRIAVFDGFTLAQSGQPVHLFGDFFMFESTLRNGCYVAVGDVNGDGFADLIGGGGPGGGPRVLIVSGRDMLTKSFDQSSVIGNYFAGNSGNRGGVRVTAKNLDDDRFADLVVGDGEGAGSRVSGYLGKNFAGGGAPEEFAFDAYPSFNGGVFVG